MCIRDRYIDDLNIGEVHPLEAAKKHLSQHKEHRLIHARFCEDEFNSINNKAVNIGMKINAEKTQLLCLSDSRHYCVNSYINSQHSTIKSTEKMKILGFIFEESPTVNAHIEYSITKFNRAIWSLSHLKRAKIENFVLLECYKVMLRPILEYCSVVYDSMLTGELVDRLERQQKTALKIIYGFGKSYEDLLSLSGIETLASRRKSAVDIFIQKLLNSERFNYLFPLNTYPEDMVNLRSTKKYKELYARTNRLFNSPLYSMRRKLNELLENVSPLD